MTQLHQNSLNVKWEVLVKSNIIILTFLQKNNPKFSWKESFFFFDELGA
jgi:hypothetical protein